MPSLPYPGLIPSNVSKDAKYSVAGGPNWEVRLVYRLNAGDRALLTTSRHDELVKMVNAVKIEHTGQAGGAFYINEFTDVVVPANGGHYFAGTYGGLLEFDFEGEVISPRASNGLTPGDPWTGPHVGIRYILSADGRDIKYEWEVSPQVQRTERLSAHVGRAAAEALAQRLAKAKGPTGGRIYINECGEFFGPPANPGDDFIYLGSLDEDAWFPAPDVPRP